jgi:cation diffusion facilitator CzcD-associated flavoprotein CzcO
VSIAHAGLAELEQRVARDLECLSYPDKPWVPPTTAPDGSNVLDCAVIGGGQFGVAIAFGLRREKVGNVTVFDSNPAGLEGPWMTFARMNMLRTPKDLTGPDLGIGSLTFRAWYEAQYGQDGWARLNRIPPAQWMDYLRWYRSTLKLDVRNETPLRKIEPVGNALFRLTFGGATETVRYARTIVLATGAEGSGARYVPPFIADSLPPHLYAHTNDAIDPALLKGKRVGILGAGASAFDYAAASLEAGATEARLFFRRKSLPQQNPRRWMEFSGFLAHYPELPDAQRWAYMHRLFDISQPPPVPTFQRATALPGFAMHPGTAWQQVSSPDGKIVVVETSTGKRFTFDYVMVATGMVVDLSLRPELATITPHFALWSDRYTPPEQLKDPRLDKFPYLGRYCDFQQKTDGEAPWLSRVFTITRGSTMSMGPSSASNSNLKYTAPRIVTGVVRQLFLDGADAFYKIFAETEHNELSNTSVETARAASR